MCAGEEQRGAYAVVGLDIWWQECHCCGSEAVVDCGEEGWRFGDFLFSGARLASGACKV